MSKAVALLLPSPGGEEQGEGNTQELPPCPRPLSVLSWFYEEQKLFKTCGYRLPTERNIMLGTVLLIVLILLLLGALPTWPHSRSWGYYPSGGLGLVLVILLILFLLGRL